MTKLEFLNALRKKLATLPQDEAEERLNFYSEMIEDRMEEGLSEADAVYAVRSVENIASQIVADIAPREPKKKNRLKAGEIVLLVLGSPIWLSLLIAAFAVVLSLYVSLWAIIISLWAVFASLVGCGLGCIPGGIFVALGGFPAVGFSLIAAGLVCAGLSIFLFFGCRYASKAAVWLTKLPFVKRRTHHVEN